MNPQFELGQVFEIELVATGLRVKAWTVQLVESHIWFELEAATLLADGERVRLHGAGAGGAWCLETHVAELSHPVLVKLAVTGRPVAIQRREYFRVPASVPVTISVTASPQAERATGELIAVMTVDLSGGGVQLETDHALVVGDKLELTVTLPARLVHVSGTVTRVAAWNERTPLRVPGRDGVRLVGVELGPMMDRDRAELVRFVHEVERKRRPSRGP